MWKRTPKYGRPGVRNWQKTLDWVNLDKVHDWVTRGRLDPNQLITMKVLRDVGLIGRGCPTWGVKLLVKDADFFEKNPMALKFEVSDASKAAQDQIERAGGSVKLVWFNRVTMRAHFKPEKYLIAPRNNGIPPMTKREKYREYMEEYIAKLPEEHQDKLWMAPKREPRQKGKRWSL